MQLSFLTSAVISTDRPKAIQVYDILRNAIVHLKLKPGDAVRKEEICELLSVSRTPVSEAMARLADEGLMDVFPQHGSYVAKIHISDVRQGAFLRRALEVGAVREVAHRITKDQVERLRRNIRYHRSALDAGDQNDFHHYDEEFHHLIAEFTGFPRVSRMLESSRGQLDRVRRLLLPMPGRLEDSLAEHEEIFDALAQHKPGKAARAMKNHLDKTPEKLELLMQQQPNMFDSGF